MRHTAKSNNLLNCPSVEVYILRHLDSFVRNKRVCSGKQIHTETRQQVYFCKKGWWQVSIFVVVVACFRFLFREHMGSEETCPFVCPTLLPAQVLGSFFKCMHE